jgi:hypothetical protein
MHGLFWTKYFSALIWNHACSYTASYGSERFILNYWFCVFIYGRFHSCVCCEMQKGVFLRMINERYCHRKVPLPVLKYYPSIYLENWEEFEKPQSEYPASGLIIEPWASRIRSSSTDLLNMAFGNLIRLLFLRGCKLEYSVSKKIAPTDSCHAIRWWTSRWKRPLIKYRLKRNLGWKRN